jgi:hypothetical protein
MLRYALKDIVADDFCLAVFGNRLARYLFAHSQIGSL